MFGASNFFVRGAQNSLRLAIFETPAWSDVFENFSLRYVREETADGANTGSARLACASRATVKAEIADREGNSAPGSQRWRGEAPRRVGRALQCKTDSPVGPG
jgi:hypothetical protein